MANQVGITKGLLSWQFQNTYIERAMDNAAYQAAHPDDTLVLAGPARRGTFAGPNGGGATSGIGTLLAIGMLQGVSFNSTKPTQPMMAIGSGRSFFVSGKSQTQWSISRLFVNGRNLLRVLYHNFVASGGDPSLFDDPAGKSLNSAFFINLDSELFYVPFGLAAIFRNKTHDLVGSFYAELCMINTYSIGINAGQSMILENVTGLSDRLLPFSVSDSGANANYAAPAATLDAILDFTQNIFPDATQTMPDDPDAALTTTLG